MNVGPSAIPAPKPFHGHDFVVWPDGFWAVLKEVWNGDYNYRSDDFEIVRQDDRARLIELGIEDDADCA
jgi:hypothetical protein